jgi:hypothetical protein
MSTTSPYLIDEVLNTLDAVLTESSLDDLVVR